MTVPSALLSHRTDEHLTPRYILDAVLECLGGIDLDPSSNSRCCPHVPAARHFTRGDDGLSQPWDGRVFLNPPFGRDVDRWFQKLAAEYCAGRTVAAVVLWKSATETRAWRILTGSANVICFPTRRIDFEGEGPRTGSTFSPALFYVGREHTRFARAFAPVGEIWVVPRRLVHAEP